MTFAGEVIRKHRVSGGVNRVSGCSAMNNRSKAHNVTINATVLAAESRKMS